MDGYFPFTARCMRQGASYKWCSLVVFQKIMACVRLLPIQSIYIKTQAKNISDQTTEGGPEGKFNEMVAVLIVGMSGLGLSVLHRVHFSVMPLLQQYKSNREKKN